MYEIRKDPAGYHIKWQVWETSLPGWSRERMVQRFQTRRTALLFLDLLEGRRESVGRYLTSYYHEHRDLPELAYETGLMLAAAPICAATTTKEEKR